jgi:hypothetical protein
MIRDETSGQSARSFFPPGRNSPEELPAELSLERFVQMVTDAAVELTGAKFGAFFYNRVDEQGEAYTLYTLSGAPREAFAKFPMPRNTARIRRVIDG